MNLVFWNSTITLEHYQQKHDAKLRKYRLSEQNLKYTVHPLEALRKCKEDPSRHPIVILRNGSPVGFFVLHGWEGVREYIDNRDAMLVRAYSIDLSKQGQGISQHALRQLPQFVHKYFPSKTEVILSVNEGNAAAQHTYEKSGFQDRGIRAQGRNSLLIVMHMNIAV